MPSVRQPSGPRRPSPQVLRRRRATALGLIILVIAAVLLVSSGGSPSRHRPAGAAAVVPGTGGQTAGHRTSALRSHPHSTPARSYGVATTQLTVVEPSSASAATGHATDGAPVRTIPTTVRYPVPGSAGGGATSDRFPLVVFSPGFDIAPGVYAGLLDAWARSGFVVAEPDYPATSPSPSGVNEGDIVNHPADLRAVITNLLDASTHGGSPLRGRIDPTAIAVAGHSDGGDVSLAVAENSCCSDARVKAAVILSGAELSAFGGRYYATRRVPLLVVQGSADTINVPGCSVQLYDQAPQPKAYLGIEGAEHEPPYMQSGPDRQGVARTVVAFLRAYLERQPDALAAVRRPGALPRDEVLSSPPSLPGLPSTACPGAP